MENTQSSELVSLGVALTQLVVKGTATAVSNKLRVLNDEKDYKKAKATYDEIVNELLNEREEAIRIAHAYKSELDQVVISDEDIEHLHNTVSSVLELLKKRQSSRSPSEETMNQFEEFEQIKELISVDTLKTMQLLGFNYKQAIGDPLTQLVRNLILSKVIEVDSLKAFRSFTTPEMVEILKNDNAFSNLKSITGLGRDKGN